MSDGDPYHARGAAEYSYGGEPSRSPYGAPTHPSFLPPLAPPPSLPLPAFHTALPPVHMLSSPRLAFSPSAPLFYESSGPALRSPPPPPPGPRALLSSPPPPLPSPVGPPLYHADAGPFPRPSFPGARVVLWDDALGTYKAVVPLAVLQTPVARALLDPDVAPLGHTSPYPSAPAFLPVYVCGVRGAWGWVGVFAHRPSHGAALGCAGASPVCFIFSFFFLWWLPRLHGPARDAKVVCSDGVACSFLCPRVGVHRPRILTLHRSSSSVLA